LIHGYWTINLFILLKLDILFVKKIQVNGRQIEIIVGYRNLSELSDKVAKFSKRVLKEDCLDLPEKTYVKHYVELTKEQQQVYKQMKKEAIAFLDGKMQSSANSHDTINATTSNYLWTFYCR
jgi:SNF2 family DNA or RNA helicase